MAKVNPELNPTGDPSWLNLSRPITQPDYDKTGETTIKGIGNVFEAGVKAADYLIKTDIDNQIYSGVDAERNKFTAQLQEAKATFKGQPMPYSKDDVEGGGGEDLPKEPMDVMSSQQRMPTPVKELSGQLEVIQNARNNGKLTQTDYYGRLDALLKGVRSQYPGYREYIDKKGSEVSGVDPANAYVRSIIGDINSYTSGTKSETDKILTYIRHNDKIPGIDGVYQKFNRGQMSGEEVVSWINQRLSIGYILDEKKKLREDTTGDRTMQKDSATDDFHKAGADIVSKRLETSLAGTKLKTPQDIMALLTKADAGEVILTDEQSGNIASVLNTYKFQSAQEIRQWLDTPDKNGKTNRQYIGNTEAEKMTNDHLAIYDKMIDRVTNKDYGRALAEARQVKAITAGATVGLLKDETMARWTREMAGFEAIAPGLVKDWFRNSMGTNMQGDLDSYFRAKSKRVYTQPDLMTTGKPTTLNDLVDDAVKQKITDKGYYNSVINIANDLKNPKATPAAQRNLVEAVFGEGNYDFLQRFKREGTTDAKGLPVSGKYAVFSQFTSQDMVNTVDKIGKDHPASWNKYVNWTENEFGKNLFPQEIQDLNTIQKNPNVKIGWDDKTHEVKLKFHSTGFFTDDSKAYQDAQKSVARLNIGLRGMARVAEKGGGDVDAYVFQLLASQGFLPNKDTESSMGASLSRAIALTKAKKQQ